MGVTHKPPSASNAARDVKGAAAESFLIKNGSTKSGLYVVTDGAESKRVVASAATPAEALLAAKAAGAKDPILIYLPRDDEKIVVY
jgi:hypothetical protein